jgi:GTP pyrophosphokinase
VVKVRSEQPRNADGQIDLDHWLQALQASTGWADVTELRRALAAVQRIGQAPFHAWDDRQTCLDAGIAIVDVLSRLRIDPDSAVAGLLYPCLMQGIGQATAQAAIGDRARLLLDGLARISPIDSLSLANSRLLAIEAKDQLENVRRMLVAMIDDVRVPVIKLAERTAAMRALRASSDATRRHVATQAMEVFAPLAHRLGIGHLRWELEDYAFRYLEPEGYRRIAAMLDERRMERERFLEGVIVEVRELLGDGQHVHAQAHHDAPLHGDDDDDMHPREAADGAQVSGRVKHLYGIWRKMQRKGVGIDEIHDIRAIRIIVEDVPQCYAVLGAIHTRWRHIPGEFDDYIANPKANGYRSLHTAVIGPEDRVLEVQIRTREMHLEAELGICAHWAYKDGVSANRDTYDDKLDWLRSALERQDAPGVLDAFGVELQHQFTEDRIYVFTPRGDVVDMMAGSTPLDFAYRIHTRIGERSHGARVDGRTVELNTPLATGQTVEILTSEHARPNRQWLDDALGYVRTERARTKIRAFFRNRAEDERRADGEALLAQALHKLGIETDLEALASSLGYRSVVALATAIGGGDLGLERVLASIPKPATGDQLSLLPEREQGDGQPRVRGAAGLRVSFATCCQPRLEHEIVGVLHDDRLVVHVRGCARAERLAQRLEHRLASLTWDRTDQAIRFEITVEALDRSGLLADVAGALAAHDINVLSSQTRVALEAGRATIDFLVEAREPERLGRAIDRIDGLPNILETQCRRVE